ncbi:hypothetical protein FM076_18720 [Streptomyces albus subsp. chlorinus]|uniref:hypothetical protein n=1 Tax=Streptomyces albus TaxID=1888 RepID=UPI00156D8C15|nr:hypothetical protein [Streptomyces albus]NSC23079.1 hypothetical protein [Streptomyces albus subsp. chlorinus]
MTYLDDNDRALIERLVSARQRIRQIEAAEAQARRDAGLPPLHKANGLTAREAMRRVYAAGMDARTAREYMAGDSE